MEKKEEEGRGEWELDIEAIGKEELGKVEKELSSHFEKRTESDGEGKGYSEGGERRGCVWVGV